MYSNGGNLIIQKAIDIFALFLDMCPLISVILPVKFYNFLQLFSIRFQGFKKSVKLV